MKNIMFFSVFFAATIASISWGNELDGKILNCKCIAESKNCLDDYTASGNEKDIAFRKHEYFRVFSIMFDKGKY